MTSCEQCRYFKAWDRSDSDSSRRGNCYVNPPDFIISKVHHITSHHAPDTESYTYVSMRPSVCGSDYACQLYSPKQVIKLKRPINKNCTIRLFVDKNEQLIKTKQITNEDNNNVDSNERVEKMPL